MDKKEKLLQKFGNNLSKIREGRALSIRQLAAAAELEYSQVQRIEKGKVNFAFTTLICLARGLDIHPKKLLDFDFDE